MKYHQARLLCMALKGSHQYLLFRFFLVGRYDVASAWSVQDIVLYDEKDIKDDGNRSETQFSRIACNAGPIPKVQAVQYELEVTEYSTRRIQQYVPDTPTFRRFPLMVQYSLGNILD